MDLAYDYVHCIAPSLRPLDDYLKLEAALDAFCAEGRESHAWKGLATKHGVRAEDPCDYASHGRDLVAQLLVAFDMRIAAASDHGSTRSVLVRSSDASGARFLVTSTAKNAAEDDAPETPYYLTKAYVDRYLAAHNGRPGMCALAFSCRDASAVAARRGPERNCPRRRRGVLVFTEFPRRRRRRAATPSPRNSRVAAAAAAPRLRLHGSRRSSRRSLRREDAAKSIFVSPRARSEHRDVRSARRRSRRFLR